MTPSLRIEIRDKRLRGGRVSLSARTTSKTVRRRREGLLRILLERGDADSIERLRAGEIHWTDVERAARTDELDALRRTTEAVTLMAVLDRVMEIVEATKALGTVKQYRVLRRQLLAEFGDDFDPADMSVERARAFLHRPRRRRGRSVAEPWSPRKQAQVVALAGRVWRYAIEQDRDHAKRTKSRPRIHENPWKAVDRPDVRATRQAFLRPEEWGTLITKADGQPVAAVLGCAYLAGLRLSEIRHLRTDVDVDLVARRLRVQSRDGEHPWRPKTARGERHVPIGDELLAILEAHVESGYAGDRYFVRTPGHDRPAHASTVTLWVQAAYAVAGIAYGRAGDALTLHSGRHTFASWLILRGVSVTVVAKLLGDRPEVVLNTYSHLREEDENQAIAVLDDVARGGR